MWDTFIKCITDLDALGLAVKDKRQDWKAQKANIERQVSGLQEQVNRRQYSWQKAEGILPRLVRIAHTTK